MFLMEHVWSQEIISKTLISVFEGTIILQFVIALIFPCLEHCAREVPG